MWSISPPSLPSSSSLSSSSASSSSLSYSGPFCPIEYQQHEGLSNPLCCDQGHEHKAANLETNVQVMMLMVLMLMITMTITWFGWCTKGSAQIRNYLSLTLENLIQYIAMWIDIKFMWWIVVLENECICLQFIMVLSLISLSAINSDLQGDCMWYICRVVVHNIFAGWSYVIHLQGGQWSYMIHLQGGRI